MSKPEHMHVPGGRGASTCSPAGRRCRFSSAGKAAIVEESHGAGTSVRGVVRRHGLTSQQLFGWRRLARLGSSSFTVRPLFVPVIVTPAPEAPPRDEPPTVELQMDGVVVRVGRDADAGASAAVIGALKSGS